VEHDSDSKSEIVLRAVKQSRRVVVDLDRPDGNAIARANVDPASNRGCESGLAVRKICGTRTRENCGANVRVEIEAIASMCDAHKRMSEWLERSLRRVVFYLHTPEKIEQSRFDVDAGGRKPETAKIKSPILEVSGKITLDSEIARKVSGR
jgi:hypothetical protein